MLLKFSDLVKKYNMNIKGVVQVGCHWAEEHEYYLSEGINKFVYVEPCKEAFQKTIDKFFTKEEQINIEKINGIPFVAKSDNSIICYNCACGEERRNDVMYVSHNNQGQSNSLLKPEKHLQQHPEIIFNDAESVIVTKLDYLDFDKSEYNLLVTDCQGYDGHVMLGALETLTNIDYICMEVNKDNVYEKNMLIDEVDKLLFDFKRVETEWVGDWGDAIFVSKRLLHL